jgi:hypothetical protein
VFISEAAAAPQRIDTIKAHTSQSNTTGGDFNSDADGGRFGWTLFSTQTFKSPLARNTSSSAAAIPEALPVFIPYHYNSPTP